MTIPSDDLIYARLAAAAYNPVPAPGVQRIQFQDISADIVGNVCAVRGTNSFATLRRDMEVIGMVPVEHPTLGPCNAGALVAALGLLPLIPAGVDEFTGHSEGGTIAALLAGLHGAKLLVTWDAPKVGTPVLAAFMAALAIRQYRFSGSIVTTWPEGLDRHVREPLIEIGEWTMNVVLAHSIDRAVAWLESAPAEIVTKAA